MVEELYLYLAEVHRAVEAHLQVTQEIQRRLGLLQQAVEDQMEAMEQEGARGSRGI